MTVREMALGPGHLAKVARVVEEGLHPEGLTLLSTADYEALAQRLMAELGAGQFWIFAIGSLIWKPDFEHTDARRGTVHGWRRSFCVSIDNWRATRETPGLLLALDRGGTCNGVAYRMPEDDALGRMLRLLRREFDYHEDIDWLRWVTVRTKEGSQRALTFYCGPLTNPSVLRLPVEEQAKRLAWAVGPAGSCAEYLYNTVSQLEALGIHDRYLWDMQARVAAEIDRL